MSSNPRPTPKFQHHLNLKYCSPCFRPQGSRHKLGLQAPITLSWGTRTEGVSRPFHPGPRGCGRRGGRGRRPLTPETHRLHFVLRVLVCQSFYNIALESIRSKSGGVSARKPVEFMISISPVCPVSPKPKKDRVCMNQ